MLKKHFRRAHSDENAVVDNYWRKGYPALRLPVSGAGRFKSDVLVFLPHCIKLILLRRAEPHHIKQKNVIKVTDPNTVTFKADEIQDVRTLAGRLSSLVYPNSVQIELVSHFPKRRRWVEKMLLDWDGKDVIMKV